MLSALSSATLPFSDETSPGLNVVIKMHMVSCRHAVVPRLNETSVSQREMGREGRGRKRWRERRVQGEPEAARPESTRDRPLSLCRAMPCPPLQKYCDTRYYLSSPRRTRDQTFAENERAGQKLSFQRRSARRRDASFMSRLKRGGEIRFPFPAALKFHPLLVSGGGG